MGNERAFSEGRAEPAVEPVGERLPLASLFTGKMNIDAQDAQDFSGNG